MEPTPEISNCTTNDVLVLDPTSEPPANSTDQAFAYLQSDRFTSEKFKIEVRGLPKFYGISVSTPVFSTLLQVLTLSTYRKPISIV